MSDRIIIFVSDETYGKSHVEFQNNTGKYWRKYLLQEFQTKIVLHSQFLTLNELNVGTLLEAFIMIFFREFHKKYLQHFLRSLFTVNLSTSKSGNCSIILSKLALKDYHQKVFFRNEAGISSGMSSKTPEKFTSLQKCMDNFINHKNQQVFQRIFCQKFNYSSERSS